MANALQLIGGSVPRGLESPTKERKVIKIIDIVRKENNMIDKEKLERLKKLADAMYYAAQQLTTDASRLHKAMDEYHKFIIHECKEEHVNEELEEAALEYANKQLREAVVTDENCPRELAVAQASLIVSGFKAGAKWQKEQDQR